MRCCARFRSKWKRPGWIWRRSRGCRSTLWRLASFRGCSHDGPHRSPGAAGCRCFHAVADPGPKPASERPWSLTGTYLAACARFHVANAARGAADAQGGVSDDEGHALDDAWHDALDEISNLRPRTPEGMQARAAVAAMVMRRKLKTFNNQTLEDRADRTSGLRSTALRIWRGGG